MLKTSESMCGATAASFLRRARGILCGVVGKDCEDFPEVFKLVLANVSLSKNRSVSRDGVDEDLARRQEWQGPQQRAVTDVSAHVFCDNNGVISGETCAEGNACEESDELFVHAVKKMARHGRASGGAFFGNTPPSVCMQDSFTANCRGLSGLQCRGSHAAIRTLITHTLILRVLEIQIR